MCNPLVGGSGYSFLLGYGNKLMFLRSQKHSVRHIIVLRLCSPRMDNTGLTQGDYMNAVFERASQELCEVYRLMRKNIDDTWESDT